MIFPLLVGTVIAAIVCIGGMFLALIGFMAVAPREFATEFDPPPALHPKDPIVTELCRHEIPGVHGKEGRVLMVEFPPRAHGDPHRHPEAIFAHVLRGTVTSHAESSPPQQHSAGDTWFGAPTELYVSGYNQGWEPAKMLIFDLADAGEPAQFFEPSRNGATTDANPRARSELTLMATQHDKGGS